MREYRKLPQDVKERVEKAVLEIIERPYTGTMLRGWLAGYHRWRIGSYRIIYMIDEENKRVIFIDVGMRRAIYD